jgi:hypothetical protein
MTSFQPETFVARAKRMWKERKFTRAFERFQCNIDVTMLCAPRMSSLNGRLIDVSKGGGMFRPCLSYLMDRRGTEGFIVVADMKLHVRIVRTLPKGYALQFVDILSDADMEAIRTAVDAEKSAIAA